MRFLFTFYRKFYRHGYKLISGQHGRPGLTAFSRAMVILLCLGLMGPLLGHALVTMPGGLVAIIVAGLLLRVVLWYRRR